MNPKLKNLKVTTTLLLLFFSFLDLVRIKQANVARLEEQRDELNSKVRALREEVQHLMEPGSHVGEVIKQMGKTKVLVKLGAEGKYVVDIDTKTAEISKCLPNVRVALKGDSYTLHKLLPSKVKMMMMMMMMMAF
jgi:26S proteasome regulatory subunit T6